MGIFSFARNLGQELTPNRDDAPAEKGGLSDNQLADLTFQNSLVRFVKGMDFPLDGFRLTYSDGTATVYGEAEAQAHRETIVIALGNLDGVERVDDRLTVRVPAPEATFYTVEKGDTLSGIARKHYGNASGYMVIFEANRPMLTDPDKIYPGQVLRIPRE